MAAAGAGPHRLARLGVIAGAVLYGVVALASGLDRASEARPSLARYVPAFAASEALRSGGRTALAAGDGRAAVRLGEAAVRNAPLDPASTALLGAARYAIADRAGADRAFRIAAQLGWRVPYTQLYMLGRALEVGDMRVAALRLDALARQNRSILHERRVLDPLERDARGRAALAERMREGAPWLGAYAADLNGLSADVLDQRALVLDEAAGQGLVAGCQPIAPIVSALIHRNSLSSAGRLWRAHCPGAASALIHDGDFANAAIDQSRSEFAWSFIGQSEASVVFDPVRAGKGQMLVIDSSAGSPRLVVRQLVLVAPGSYRLSWQAQDSAGQPSSQMMASFTCNPDPRQWQDARFANSAGRWTMEVTVDAACPARWLGFAVKGGAAGVRFGAVRLEALNP